MPPRLSRGITNIYLSLKYTICIAKADEAFAKALFPFFKL